jgi:hypothetical protein
MLRDDRSLLRLHVCLHERRLHVLRLLQQHAALLRRLLVPTSESRRRNAPRTHCPDFPTAAVQLFFRAVDRAIDVARA